jgi:hypothetical protein
VLCVAGGRFTGAALNPARVIGPMAVFKCGKDVAWWVLWCSALTNFPTDAALRGLSHCSARSYWHTVQCCASTATPALK